MTKTYRTCRKCQHPDVSARFRDDLGTVACAECYLDALTVAAEEPATDDDRLFTLSPAAVRALAQVR